MGVLQGTRVQHLVLTGAGVQPTIPSPSTLTSNDSGWQSTNLHKGEWAYNETDDIWYYRQGNTIKPFSADVTGKQSTSEKDASNGYVGLTLFKINFKNVVGNIVSFFTNSNTAARTYTYQDRDGVIADDTDITSAKNRSNHTGTQAPSTINQDASNRFVTDTEKSTWNAKADTTYVDSATQGLKWKEEVKAATTANITLSGAQTIDGVSIVAGDRVLVKDQTTGSQNGIYVAAAGAWSRSTDANTTAKIKNATVPVSQGTANADKDFVLVTDTLTLGTTALVFTEKGGNVPNASETSAGKVEEATDAEMLAGTSTGSTGARLFVGVGKLITWFSGLLTFGTVTDASSIDVDFASKKILNKKWTITGSTRTLNFINTSDGAGLDIRSTLSGITSVVINLTGTGLTFYVDGVLTTVVSFSGASGSVFRIIAKIEGSKVDLWTSNPDFITQGGNSFNSSMNIKTTDAQDVIIGANNTDKIKAKNGGGVEIYGGGTSTNAALEVFDSTKTQSRFKVQDDGQVSHTAAKDYRFETAGGGIAIKEGANAKCGIATLSSGTVTVNNTKVTAGSRIQLTVQSLGTVASPKAVAVTGRVVGTSFTITSADNTDTSTVAWTIIEGI